jgi:hypothetical protein
MKIETVFFCSVEHAVRAHEKINTPRRLLSVRELFFALKRQCAVFLQQAIRRPKVRDRTIFVPELSDGVEVAGSFSAARQSFVLF